jgi:hypothetical protein
MMERRNEKGSFSFGDEGVAKSHTHSIWIEEQRHFVRYL